MNRESEISSCCCASTLCKNRRIIAKQGKSSRLRVVQQKAKKRLRLGILLKVFAFLLCFVLYVYVMIFQFEIKHKVPCNGIHLPVGSGSRWRSCSSRPTPSTTLHTGTLFKSIKPIAFTPFFCRYKISYALNFCHAFRVWFRYSARISSGASVKGAKALCFTFENRKPVFIQWAHVGQNQYEMKIKNLHRSEFFLAEKN